MCIPEAVSYKNNCFIQELAKAYFFWTVIGPNLSLLKEVTTLKASV